jgi:hypothetical protein
MGDGSGGWSIDLSTTCAALPAGGGSKARREGREAVDQEAAPAIKEALSEGAAPKWSRD